MANSLRDQLQSIYQKKGELTPQAVVDEARSEVHPLHSRFEWDDAKAGEAYRRVQAQQIIRSVKIEFTDPSTQQKSSVRAYSSIREGSGSGQYKPTEEVLADPFSEKLLYRELEREIASLQKKYGHLRQFKEIIAQAIA